MSNKSDCPELLNLQYKTMLLNGNKKAFTTTQNDISNLDILLDKECNINKKESWNKLDKSIKMEKINNYIKQLVTKHSLTTEEKNSLQTYLSSNLDKKNLYRNKDVTYIKDSGKLENIPILHFNNTTRKFTLKKHPQSTSKSLGPTRKVNRSKSNKNNTDSDSSKLVKSLRSHKNKNIT